MADKFLDSVYGAKTPSETRQVYDHWSKTYNAEIQANGYATPDRSARILADLVADKTTPILDFGCGTGLSGAALAAQGFSTIDGMDVSEDMMAQARSSGHYRSLSTFDPEAPPPIERGAYPVIAAIGVIGAGAAPASTLDTLMQALAPGGLCLFSLNDHALADADYTGTAAAWIASAGASERCNVYGDHLPGIGLKASIIVYERL